MAGRRQSESHSYPCTLGFVVWHKVVAIVCPATTVVSNFGGLGHPLFTSEHPDVYSALWGIWVMSTGYLFGVSMGYYGKSLFVALFLQRTRQTEHSSVSRDIKTSFKWLPVCIEETGLAESVETMCLECPPA